MVADGVNPFGNQSTKYSMWPILLLIYNLLLWLVSKNFFISLTLLIPGDRAPTPEAFDIFISPLVRDLQELWHGIRTVDSSNRDEMKMFTMRGILLWTMNDLPAYGIISGQQTKGYKGYPVCVSETCAIHSGVLKKMLYLGNRRWLPEEHRFRRASVAFDGHTEFCVAPERPSGHEILRMAEERVAFIAGGGRRDGDDDPVKEHGVKRVSVLYDLPYWVVSKRITY